MADEDGKTEKPTEHKLKKARKEGNVPRSEDLNGFVAILVSLITVFVFSLIYPERVIHELGLCMTTLWQYANSHYNFVPDCLVFSNTWLEMTAFMFGTMIFAAFLSYFIMNKGFVIPKEPIKFNLEALDLGKNLQNLFKAENAISTAISVGKEVLFYAVFYFIFIYFLPGLVYETFCFENCKGTTSLYYIYILLAAYTVIAFIFMAIDYPLKIIFWTNRLKMSHKDIKDEQKDIDGNPEIKQAQREFRWDLMNGAPRGPKNATFFIRGGTTIWGVRYNRAESPAPIIVAIGKNAEQANKIAQVAQQMRRLVVTDDEFSRLLSGKAVLGRPIPLEYIIQVRRCIMQLRQWEEKFGPVHPAK